MLSPGCSSLDSLSEAVPFFSPRPPPLPSLGSFTRIAYETPSGNERFIA